VCIGNIIKIFKNEPEKLVENYRFRGISLSVIICGTRLISTNFNDQVIVN